MVEKALKRLIFFRCIALVMSTLTLKVNSASPQTYSQSLTDNAEHELVLEQTFTFTVDHVDCTMSMLGFSFYILCCGGWLLCKHGKSG